MSYMTTTTQPEQEHAQETRDQSSAGNQKPSRPNYGGEGNHPSSGSSTSNFSTSSIAYHPPDLRALSAMVRSPTRGFYSGTSLLYSTSGFDMLSVIARVVTRPNPVVNLGPVDHSCSFVVVDPHTPDHEIVYCSPTFCQLTRYPPEAILNKNCRFLQSPDGIVEPGSTRIHTDHQAVRYFKDATINHQECQVTLINYKNGGEPFLNLVTIVPIAWDSDEIRYHVGFQADLVEAPRQLMENVRIGSQRYSVNTGPMKWSQ
ncbi:White collar 1 protein [Rhizoctonia solani]|uniref:White collar 1 protein n=1 Tax=Rhizoctonia solani TaxID=456999 RepID=A0A0K6GDW0_9AGAM|nr:White collar 1 protein [Rhizoctonia solani]